MAIDLSQYEEDSQVETQGDDKLAQLTRLGQEMLRRKQTVAEAEDALARAKVALSDITEKALPELMTELGLVSFRLSSGQEIAIGEVLRANISEERRDAAHDWLEQHGLGDIIKRKVIVAFNREQETEAQELVKMLSEHETPLNVAVERKVESQTLNKTVRELVEQGELPDDALLLLGVFRKTIADIATTRKKKKGKSSDPF